MLEKIIQDKLGVAFSNTTLLKTAFTHASYANERSKEKMENNERLEFLGDAVIEIIVSEHLFHTFLQWPEGKMTRFRAQLVCEQSLSTFAKDCGFDKLVLLGKGEEVGGGRQRNALLCDVFEAFVGALYLDKGMDFTKAFVLSHIQPLLEAQEQVAFVDYKTKLQELLQRNGNVKIQYDIIRETGLSHDKWFESTVSVNGHLLGQGSGKNKKSAEQEAAKQALEEGKYKDVFR